MSKTSSLDPNDITAKLEQRRQEILSLIEGHGDDGKPVQLDQTRVGRLSRMDAMQHQAMAKETDRRRQQQLLAIDRALKRLADGVYGDCLECGEPIAEKRLALDPSTPLCIGCAEEIAR